MVMVCYRRLRRMHDGVDLFTATICKPQCDRQRLSGRHRRERFAEKELDAVRLHQQFRTGRNAQSTFHFPQPDDTIVVNGLEHGHRDEGVGFDRYEIDTRRTPVPDGKIPLQIAVRSVGDNLGVLDDYARHACAVVTRRCLRGPIHGEHGKQTQKNSISSRSHV